MQNVRINDEDWKVLNELKEKTKIPMIHLLAEAIKLLKEKQNKKSK